MCSILGIFDVVDEPEAARRLALELSRRQRHRGPDWSGVYADDGAVLAHERLAIVDVEGGAQPIRSADGALALAVNGEIYNHRELEAGLGAPYDFQTGSDCEVINALWRQEGVDFLPRLNGIFAFALRDAAGGFLVARDPIGVCPLYYGRDEHGQLLVASEMKALVGVCKSLAPFPPGCYLTESTPEPVPYRRPAWREYSAVEGVGMEPAALRQALESAVHRQLMSDVPYGVLLSGGLDSSVVAASAARYAARRVEADDAEPAWWPRLHSFSVGLVGSPDLAAARTVAESLGTVHHEFHFTVQEGLDALSDVIFHIESFDVTTVRASTPMFLMARRIKAMGVKMVLSGEGADEIFGGYLYFHKAPSAEAFHAETVRKLDELHRFDCLRANKSMAAWGVEARVPFLDLAFLDVAMGFDPALKMVRRSGAERGRGLEKEILRHAFDGMLPEPVLWRQKEQFSDGVGYGWIDTLKQVAAEQVSDQQFERADRRFPSHVPATKEAYMYRAIFESWFPGQAAAETVPHGMSIACSTPTAIRWDRMFKTRADPSGRAVEGVHRDAY
jgi:asparagine synthase (glutamine-hydrolysing)